MTQSNAASPPGRPEPAGSARGGDNGPLRQPTIDVVDLAIRAADAYGREDLSAILGNTRRRLTDRKIRILVVGEYKQGKSSLVNSLLNAPVCPVDDDVATSVPTAVQYSAEPFVVAIREPEEDQGEPVEEELTFAALPAWVAEAGNPGNVRGIRSVEVGIPRRFLEQGVVIVDTPGAGGLGSANTATTLAALPLADAIVFVSDASQEYSQPELDFLATARSACPTVLHVLTKADFYPEWRRIRALDIGHLGRLGVDSQVVATSAALRQRAVKTNDQAMNLESGYPELVQWIQHHVVAQAEVLTTRAAVTDLDRTVGQLRASLDAEREALEDPERAQALAAEFEEARQRAEELKGRAARWQITLSDGVADLSADVDHLLRGRMRTITREAEETIDSQDPGTIWDEFEAWLRRRVTHDVADTYLELSTRTTELSSHVADHFGEGGAAIEVVLDAEAPLGRAAGIDSRGTIDPTKLGLAGGTMTAMRGSYSGFLMFGMLGQLAGLTLLNPATAVVGLLMGRKAFRDEKQRQLTVKRQQAMAAVRQFVDEATFQVGKELRDSLRHVQRELRDAYTLRADELSRSLTDALTAAKSALRSGEEERAERLLNVRAELARIDALTERIGSIEKAVGSASASKGGQ